MAMTIQHPTFAQHGPDWPRPRKQNGVGNRHRDSLNERIVERCTKCGKRMRNGRERHNAVNHPEPKTI